MLTPPHPRLFLLCSNGTVGDANGADVPYCEGLRDGDVVGVLLDMDCKTLTYYINGSNRGVALSGFSAACLHPAVCLYYHVRVPHRGSFLTPPRACMSDALTSPVNRAPV